jgi:hypothetical protein
MKGQRVIAVDGIRSKATSISERHRKIALERKKDWLERSRK